LDIAGCRLLTDSSVIAIADNCPHLVKFYVAHNHNITDVSVMKLAEGCKELTEVTLRDCEKITDASLDKFGELCPMLPNLQSVDVYNCPRITKQGKDRLQQKIHKLALNLK